jgi:hypothetical protein
MFFAGYLFNHGKLIIHAQRRLGHLTSLAKRISRHFPAQVNSVLGNPPQSLGCAT